MTSSTPPDVLMEDPASPVGLSQMLDWPLQPRRERETTTGLLVAGVEKAGAWAHSSLLKQVTLRLELDLSKLECLIPSLLQLPPHMIGSQSSGRSSFQPQRELVEGLRSTHQHSLEH